MGWRRKKSWYRKTNCRLGRQQYRPKDLAFEGRNFEDKVERIMIQMCNRGNLSSVIHHPPNSFEDQNGKDFTVSKVINGEIVTKSFGLTFSMSRELRATKKHPDVPQKYIPLWASDKEIEDTILSLFSQRAGATAA